MVGSNLVLFGKTLLTGKEDYKLSADFSPFIFE
jgi:hypothetical protein